MTVQLGRQRIREGQLDRFIKEWRTGVVPLRESFGFSFTGAWSLPESNEFVFVVQHDGDFDKANRAYFESEERKQLTPNPAVHIEETSVSVAEVVLQRRTQRLVGACLRRSSTTDCCHSYNEVGLTGQNANELGRLS